MKKVVLDVKSMWLGWREGDGRVVNEVTWNPQVDVGDGDGDAVTGGGLSYSPGAAAVTLALAAACPVGGPRGVWHREWCAQGRTRCPQCRCGALLVQWPRGLLWSQGMVTLTDGGYPQS